MPGASRARSLVCEDKKHTSKSPQVQHGQPGIPRASGFNGFLRALPGVHDVLVTVACGSQHVGPDRADIGNQQI